MDANIFKDKDLEVLGRKYENCLCRIERFVSDVISTDEVAFKIVEESHGRPIATPLRLGNYMSSFNGYINQYDEKYVYSELVNLFFSTCQEMRLTFDVFKGRSQLMPNSKFEGEELFNEFVGQIRSAAARSDFKKKLYAREYNSVRNFASVKEYVNELFEKHSRLLVLRIDFGYTLEAAKEITAEKAHADREKFLNNRRSNKLFASLLGYVWKLEYGEEKGHHFHFTFFYDGSAVHKDAYLGNKIGKYWVDLVSDKRGLFHNCNASKGKYKRCGIGMISHFEVAKRENLLLALQYLAKKDQYLRVKGSNRVFGRGEMPRQRTCGAGRPRIER